MPIRRIKQTIEELGTVNGLFYLVAQILSKVSRGRVRLVRYYLVAQPVPVAGNLVGKPNSQSVIDFIAPCDPVVAAFPRPPEVITRRFEAGYQCLVAKYAERFAGFIWFARDRYEEDEVRCCYELLQPDQSAWDFDVYVEPSFRIGRTFGRLWDAANQHLAAEGVKWSFSRISAFNPNSIKVHRRLGIQTIFTATFLCCGPFQLTIVGVRPFVHISFSKKSVPKLRLSSSPLNHRPA